jgi:uncharacterized membrane protein YkvA (DUF1232 family)
MRLLVRTLPDIVRLVARLVVDPRVPRGIKLALVAAAVYLASPLDLVPDVLPLAGWLDDLLLAAAVLDGVVSHVDRALILKYWPGTPESLDRVARVARVLAAWVPRRLRGRVFSPRGASAKLSA